MALTAFFLSVVAAGPTTAVDPHAAPPRSLDLIFVLDNSGSMRANDPSFLTRRSVIDFAGALEQEARLDVHVGLVLFDETATLVRSLSEIGEAGKIDPLRRALGRLDYSGQRTNSPAGIERAVYELRQNGREDARKAIVFLTDGKIDTGSVDRDLEAARHLREDLAAESEALGIRIFGIAFTDAADYRLLQVLARRTQASYFRAYAAADLAPVIQSVLDQVAAPTFYELASLPSRPAPGPLPTPANAAGPSDPAPTPPDAPLSDLARASQATATNAPPTASTPEGPGASQSSATDETARSLLGWIPLALFLAAGAFFWLRRRGQSSALDATAMAPAFAESDPPAAQLLDPGGQMSPAGTAHPLSLRRTRIGRDPHNDVTIDDDAVSSEHAIVEFRGGRYWLEDLRSTNGTRLSGKRVDPAKRVALKGGDSIRFAEIELMFVLAGYVPGGATAYLSSSTVPPGSLSILDLDRQIEQAESEDASQGEAAALANPPPDVPPANEPRSATPESPNPPNRPALRACLDDHLQRVSAITPEFAAFVDYGFDPEMREATVVTAQELSAVAVQESSPATRIYTAKRIRYCFVAVPAEMDQARDYFVEAYGGFTRLITEHLHAESFRADRCEILAVLTFGAGQSPWVSLTLVPEESQDLEIDLLSYEFLTEAERHAIEPQIDRELSQSGLR